MIMTMLSFPRDPIGSPCCRMMIDGWGVQKSPPKCKVFRFHDHSQVLGFLEIRHPPGSVIHIHWLFLRTCECQDVRNSEK